MPLTTTTFSVVTVVLNNREGLLRTHASVAGQRYQDIEWLVFDGGSNDGTIDWLEEQQYLPLRWWCAPDKGLFDAMNRGLDHALGDYIVFLNGGDEFAHDKVLEQVAAVARTPPEADFIYGDAIDISPDGNTTYYRHSRSHDARWWTMFACHQAMFFRRDRIGSLRYRLEYRNAGDYQFVSEFLHPVHAGGGVVVRRIDGAICRFWLGGISTQHRVKTLAEDFDIRRRFLGIRLPLNIGLFVVHRIHTWMKRHFFSMTRRLRW